MHESGFGRVLGALVAPDKTFRSIAERPTWVVPLILLVVLGLSVGLIMQRRVDQAELIKYQMDRMGVELSKQQMEKIENDAAGGSGVRQSLGLAFGTLVAAAAYFVLAAVFLMILRLAGSEIDFLSSLAVTVHGMLPLGVAALLNIPLALSRSEISPAEVMSGGLLASNLRPLAPEGSPVVASLLGSLDFFAIWAVVLLILGFRRVARISTQTSATIVLVLWGLFVLGKAGIAAVFN
ncbi:MAG TPA: YIP1 family protein [Thermoanaerobaculia bacterium]|nr:YIP1 family protein [Thermoanaerobaculia bacterium]